MENDKFPSINPFNALFRPGKVVGDIKNYQTNNPTINPYQQMMARQYLQENPDADFGGIPGYEGIQKKYDAKIRSQAPFGPMEKRKESDTKTVQMGGGGFEPIGDGSRKDYVIGKIQEKIATGQPIAKMEKQIYNKYYNINEGNTTGPKTAKDRVLIRKGAMDRAKADMVNMIRQDADTKDPALLRSELEAAKDYEPTEEEIQDYILDEAMFQYPDLNIDEASTFMDFSTMGGQEDQANLSDEDRKSLENFASRASKQLGVNTVKTKEGKKINFDIEIPSNIMGKGYQGVVDYLVKSGMSEQEAALFIKKKTEQEIGQ